MAPNLKAVSVFAGPVRLETGEVSRMVNLSDGRLRIETWSGKDWVEGGAGGHEFIDRPPASPELMTRLGIPDDGLPEDQSAP